MNACMTHKWRTKDCEACDRLNAPRFDPSTNLTLKALRSAWRQGPDERDKADGTVRVLTLSDIFDWVERESRGDVS